MKTKTKTKTILEWLYIIAFGTWLYMVLSLIESLITK